MPDILRNVEARLVLLFLAVALIGQLFADELSLIHLAVTALLTGMITLSLGFTASGTGLVPLGQGAFYGVGAYTAAILTTTANVPSWTGPLVGALTGALLALVSAFSIRLRDVYYSMATVALATIAHIVALSWIPVTRGPMGIMLIPRPSFFGWVVESDLAYLYVVMACLLVCYYLCWRVSGYRFGRALKAIHHNESAAIAMGINPVLYKLKVIVLGGAIAGLAGGLYAQFMGYLNPQVLNPMASILLLAMVVVGGLHSLAGAAIGGILIHAISGRLQGAAGYSMLVYGAVIIACMVWLPEGLAGLFGKLRFQKPSAAIKPLQEETPHA